MLSHRYLYTNSLFGDINLLIILKPFCISSDNMASTLQLTEVIVMDNNACNATYSGAITDAMICAGIGNNTNRDTCQVGLSELERDEFCNPFFPIFSYINILKII